MLVIKLNLFAKKENVNYKIYDLICLNGKDKKPKISLCLSKNYFIVSLLILFLSCQGNMVEI